MEKYKMMYKTMYDDLKDSDMLIDYAYKLKEKGEMETARYMAERAKVRMEQLAKIHELFKSQALAEEQSKEVDSKKVRDCLWEETHKHLVEWAHSIKEKIKAF